jgi:putative flippase GtrA
MRGVALLGKLGRFGSVGIASAMLYAGGMATAVDLLGWSVMAANIFGFLMAASCSYLGHHYFTYGADGDHRRYVPRFLVQAVATYLLSTGITFAVAQFGLHYSWGVLLVVGLIPAINFCVMQFWVFATGGDIRPQP